ncbi:hypothetical protein DZF89_11350 [Vibrio parahaemolyticus]|nr:hypothetical protein [Vibrio parahaemolyticus]
MQFAIVGSDFYSFPTLGFSISSFRLRERKGRQMKKVIIGLVIGFAFFTPKTKKPTSQGGWQILPILGEVRSGGGEYAVHF